MRTYDIVNAGPRNRFMANGKIVSNSGRGIQLQNLYRNTIDTLESARELVKAGNLKALEVMYGNTPDILAQLIRTMLIPKEGHEFIIADYSAIEARVLAWEADEEGTLDDFRQGRDLYCAVASRMFGVPVEKHGENAELRQKGKIATLACIAEGSLVLTDKGLIPIEDVTTDELVWDGEEWVKHEGVIYKGEREVIAYDGLTATPDHLVFIEGKQGAVRFEDAAASGAHLIQTGDGRRAIRLGENYQSGEEVESVMGRLLCAHGMHGVWKRSVDTVKQSDKRSFKGVPKLFTTETDTTMARSKADRSETTVRKPKGFTVQELWSKRNKVRLSKCDGSRTFFNPGIWNTRQEDGDRQGRQRRRLCSGECSFCYSGREYREQKDNGFVEIRSEILALCESHGSKKAFSGADKGTDYSGCGDGCIRKEKELEGHQRKVRVYDIRNAGRHHRFTVSGKLVHNCGYQGGAGALISMGALEMGLSEAELPEIIGGWRSANPHVVQYWWDVQDAAMKTTEDHQDRTVNRLRFSYYAGTLWIVLPSGRALAFLKPRLAPNRFGHMSLTFEGTGNTEGGGKWGRQETYGGKLVENCTQGIARDLLVDAMLRMEKAGLNVVAHIHDEVVIESPIGAYTVDEVCELMAKNPSWADGLPLAADGYRGDFYFKS